MSDDRKYRQRGYQDDGREPAGAPASGEIRSRVVTDYKETVRCAQCGADISILFEAGEESRCTRCGAALHSCRNCHSFDPSARFECSQPIRTPIRKKDAANQCTFFKARTILVKDISHSAPSAPDDARRALEDLFKK